MITSLIAARASTTGRRFIEFFTANIRNPNTRRAYYRVVTEFRPITQSDAWRMLQRRAQDAGIPTAVCNQTFRATGITAYLDNGGSLEKRPGDGPRTTKLLRSHRRPDHAR